MSDNSLNLALLSDLAPDKKLELEAQLLGYIKMPPTIREFIEDPYYLGNIYGGGKLYEFWMPILEEIFPDAISTRYNNIVLTGAVGIGKSTISQIISMYLYARLDHLKNFDIFKLSAGKDFVFTYFHTTTETAIDTFTDPIEVTRSMSPYFSSGLLTSPGIHNFIDTPRSKGPIGMNVMFYVLSEINFIAPEKAQFKLDTALNRVTSRFKRVEDWFSNIIIDSSAAGEGSFVDEYVEHKFDMERTIVVRPTHWEVKKHDFGHVGWFQVYLGDSSREPFIVNRERDDSYIMPNDLDPDKMLDVPMELWNNFRTNLELSLQDLAGISTSSTDNFIMDRESLHEAFCLPMKHPEVIEVDFYDLDARLYHEVSESLKVIPLDKVISVGIDIGVSADLAGISIAYFDKWIVKDDKNKTKIPTFCVPVVIGLGRIHGQETSISLLYEFIKDLSKKWEVGAIVADSYQSRQLLQDLERDKFNAYMISVDRTSDAYQSMKLALYEKRLKITDSRLLQRELRELKSLRRNGKQKVDHPETTKADMYTNGRGSKDIADSMTSAIEAINREIDVFVNLSKHYIRTSYQQHMKKQVVSNKQTIMKDMKKMARTGGWERFRKKQLERSKVLAEDRVGEIRTEKRVPRRDLDM